MEKGIQKRARISTTRAKAKHKAPGKSDREGITLIELAKMFPRTIRRRNAGLSRSDGARQASTARVAAPSTGSPRRRTASPYPTGAEPAVAISLSV